MPDRTKGTADQLTEREVIALRFIQQATDSNPLRRPPTMRQLLEHLNDVLPARKDGKPAINSTNQVHRIVISLRAKGLLHEVEPGERIPNMVLTATGKRQLSRLKSNA